ncbi:hypothetical protein [Coleofasciculus sp.]
MAIIKKLKLKTVYALKNEKIKSNIFWKNRQQKQRNDANFN